MSQHNTMVPGVRGPGANGISTESGSGGYRAAREGAATIDRSERAWIVVSGNDRRSYLHGLLTNDIASLEAGHGCYAAYLTPQGRMIADLWVYELGDVVLLSMCQDVRETVLTKLDQFVFTEDVKLEDASSSFAALAIVGPRAADLAASVLTGVSRDLLAALAEHGNVRAQFRGQPAIGLRVTDTGEAGFDLLTDASQHEALKQALRAAGAVEVDDRVADAIRIEAGIPKFHHDMDEDTIPLEAGIESRAISFTKGCYVGQEVIVRVLHRGHGRVARKLVGLKLDGEVVPASGADVRVDARDAGKLTSSAFSPALQRPIALAYLHRDYVAPGTSVTVDGVTGAVTALPFVIR